VAGEATRRDEYGHCKTVDSFPVRTVSIGDNVRLLGRAATNDVEGKSNKLRMCPGQRCGRERTGARNETGLAGWRFLIPNLLG
jgi:hypothetical protein